MFLLDTNAFDLFFLGETNLVHQVTINARSVFVSSVTAEELLTGRMSGINRARAAKTSLSVVKAHEDFVKSLENLRIFPIFTYTEDAERIFQALPAGVKRTGTQDCRIAALAIAHGMTVVTRNTRDFEAIGAPFVDWSL